jgi:hypothetical protein
MCDMVNWTASNRSPDPQVNEEALSSVEYVDWNVEITEYEVNIETMPRGPSWTFSGDLCVCVSERERERGDGWENT